MEREFKANDRVLVRNHDLADWECGILFQQHNNRSHPFSVCLEKNGIAFNWTQCRHIDDFRAGDKVQGWNLMDKKWEDATYVGRVNSKEQSLLMPDGRYCCYENDEIRWHPSMPWAKENPLTLEQRVESLERKLNEL